VSGDAYWERITYFLERVIPVAEEYKIRMALHPHDPGVPPEGYQGVDCVLGTVDGLKRFLTIKASPYHGLNYFGSRQKIFNVHFRNIRGRRNDFQEVYPDEGDVDFVKAMQVYKEVGYPYLLMPDHVPEAPGDASGLQSFAFCYGYIRALIQAADRLA
jgi:mannonate dehydratase